MSSDRVRSARTTRGAAVWLLAGLLLSTGATVIGAAAPPSPISAATRYLFSHFVGSGADGLHFAGSEDGLTWQALRSGASFLTPQVGSKLMRDPCVFRGPDGVFHLVWTTGWYDRGIGLAHSRNLIDWSEQEFVPVMGHEPGAQNCWAPEMVFDAAAGHYVIFWSTTVVGRFSETAFAGSETFKSTGETCNHRIYFTTTRDFRTFSRTALLYEPGFSCIDATMAPAAGRWVMWLKDETKMPVAKKHIRVAWADAPTGPWGPAGPAISADWVEGPSVLQLDGRWYVYYDAYRRRRYEGLSSTDLQSWVPLEGRLQMPAGLRHGTAFAVPRAIFEAIAGPGRATAR
jgi:hypothetical protein